MPCSKCLEDFTERKTNRGETHMKLFTLVPAAMLVSALVRIRAVISITRQSACVEEMRPAAPCWKPSANVRAIDRARA